MKWTREALKEILGEDDSQLEVIYERGLESIRAKEQEAADLEAEHIAIKKQFSEFFIKHMELGVMGGLEMDKEESKSVLDWAKAVENGDKTAIVELSGSVLDILHLEVFRRGFLYKKRHRGEKKNNARHYEKWAYSERYCISAAALEFNVSESAIKKSRRLINENPNWQGMSIKRRDEWIELLLNSYEFDKRKVEFDQLCDEMDKINKELSDSVVNSERWQKFYDMKAATYKKLANFKY